MDRLLRHLPLLTIAINHTLHLPILSRHSIGTKFILIFLRPPTGLSHYNLKPGLVTVSSEVTKTSLPQPASSLVMVLVFLKTRMKDMGIIRRRGLVTELSHTTAYSSVSSPHPAWCYPSLVILVTVSFLSLMFFELSSSSRSFTILFFSLLSRTRTQVSDHCILSYSVHTVITLSSFSLLHTHICLYSTFFSLPYCYP